MKSVTSTKARTRCRRIRGERTSEHQMGLFSQGASAPTHRLQSRIAAVTRRITQIEQELARLRLNAVTCREVLLLSHQKAPPPTIEKNELRDRIVGLFDLAWSQVLAIPGDGAQRVDATPEWERMYVEARELLACLELRPLFPEGAFDPTVAKAVEVVAVAQPGEDRTILALKAPAIVRDGPSGQVVVRPAAVVVADARVKNEPLVPQPQGGEQ